MADSDIFVSNDVQLDVDFGTMYVIDQGVAVKIVADKYDPTKTYAIGDYVIYADLLYKCIIAISEPEEFNSEKWTKVKLATEIEQINNSVSQKADKNSVYDKPTIDTKVAELNDAIALKANANDIYTKSETYNQTEVDGALDTKADKSNTYVKDEVYNKTQVDSIINNLPAPMIFKGTLGTNGTIADLPVASSDNEGFTYKVITDGTYASISAKVGDMFTSNGSAWVHIPSGDETFTDTWRSIKVNGTEKLTGSITSGSVDFKNGTNSTAVFDPSDNSIKFNIDGYTQNQTDAKLADKADKSNTYTQTEVDNLIKNAISDLMPVDTASGRIAAFETNIVDVLQEVKCEINATGGNGTPDNPNPINGYSEANITRCGVNLWDEEWELGAFNIYTGEPATDTNRIRAKNYIQIKPNTSYYFIAKYSTNDMFLQQYYYDENYNYLGRSRSGSYSPTSTNNPNYENPFTTPANAYYMRFVVSPSYGTSYRNDISINYPATDTNYHAYNGNTVTISFGQEVYGGQLITLPDRTYMHVTHGKYTGTWGDGVNDYTPDTMPDMKRRTFILSPQGGDITANNGHSKTNITDVFSTSNNLNSPHFYVYDNLYLYAPRTMSDSNPIECSFVLAAPFDIDLTPEVVSAIVGTNNVYSDTNGDTTVKFKDSIQHYIDKHIT